MDVPVTTSATNALENKVVSAAENWFRQPTTITGLATIAGGLATGLVQAIGHQTSLSTVLGVAVFAVFHLVVNDNTASS